MQSKSTDSPHKAANTQNATECNANATHLRKSERWRIERNFKKGYWRHVRGNWRRNTREWTHYRRLTDNVRNGESNNE